MRRQRGDGARAGLLGVGDRLHGRGRRALGAGAQRRRHPAAPRIRLAVEGHPRSNFPAPPQAARATKDSSREDRGPQPEQRTWQDNAPHITGRKAACLFDRKPRRPGRGPSDIRLRNVRRSRHAQREDSAGEHIGRAKPGKTAGLALPCP